MKFSIPQDKTLRPNMKTLYGSARDDRVMYLNDIVYAERNGQELHLQMLVPYYYDYRREACPLVVFIQGSAWHKQDTYRELPNLYPIARQGFIVASIEHTASDDAIFPAAVEDIKTAIRFLRAHAQEYGIDKEKVAVMGSSSGGNLAQMIGFTGDLQEFKTDLFPEESDSVNAIVDFYGPTDVTRINEGPRNPEMDLVGVQPEDVYFGARVADHPEVSAKGNPLNYISEEKEIPPILIFHGDQDDVVPFCQSVALYDKLTECNKLVEFYKVMSASHGIYLWTDQVMEICCRFLKMYLS